MHSAQLDQVAALESQGRLDEAERICAGILDAAPDHAPAVHQAGILLYRRGRHGEAIEWVERAIALAPGVARYHGNIAELYRKQARLDDALRHGLRAVELGPDEPRSHYNLGLVQYDLMDIDAAIQSMRRALALDGGMASAHFELAEGLLLSGQFEEGWREYEWRYAVPGAAPLVTCDQPVWDGSPMGNRTLMLIGDQGFGDTIQFSRYIGEAARRCPNFIVACSTEMVPLLAQLAGAARCFNRIEQMPEVHAYYPLSGLPGLFGTRADTIPAPIPYLRADPEQAQRWRERLDRLIPRGYRRIGLVWAGRKTHGNDFNRSMRLAQLRGLTASPGIALIALQKGPAQAEIGQYFGPAPLFNLGAEIEDFSDTMAILAGLDRLISVDTSVAHLAGAMGIPVSLLLPYAPDWRWQTGRGDTPWYPTVTLCRQDAPSQWEAAIAAMLQTLPR